jgi:hypothetical protein
MLTFLPHSSHKLQPIDRTVFGPYKKFYNIGASEWMLSNRGKPMTMKWNKFLALSIYKHALQEIE